MNCSPYTFRAKVTEVSVHVSWSSKKQNRECQIMKKESEKCAKSTRKEVT